MRGTLATLACGRSRRIHSSRRSMSRSCGPCFTGMGPSLRVSWSSCSASLRFRPGFPSHSMRSRHLRCSRADPVLPKRQQSSARVRAVSRLCGGVPVGTVRGAAHGPVSRRLLLTQGAVMASGLTPRLGAGLRAGHSRCAGGLHPDHWRHDRLSCRKRKAASPGAVDLDTVLRHCARQW